MTNAHSCPPPQAPAGRSTRTDRSLSRACTLSPIDTA
ncbi:hypothetical protein Ae706Ps2_6699 [Pseudonocardia sp. Ae706_Ps2]|nr:hypothetical protein Ae706Ps2_6699 [Pseudonocardia sp. Ae706_Ps2]